LNLLSAWLVHFYTALGAILALLTLFFVGQAKFQVVFGLMSLAVLIDATDGTLARKFRVKETLPWFDGDRLDDIVDYLNYVLVPCVFLVGAHLLPERDALWLAALPLLASAYGFCQKEAKSADHFFLGFPSYWNIVAFYFYVLRTPLWVNGFLVIFFSVLVFVPIKYLYPSRSPVLRGLTVTLGALWGILVLLIIYRLPGQSTVLVFGSLFFPTYYMLLSFWLEIRRRSASV
jgi:phosphatidylcholine synthase